MTISKDQGKQQYKNLNFDTLRHMGGLCIYGHIYWLDCTAERHGTKKIDCPMKCQVCTKFTLKNSMKNFCDKWVVGADLVRVSMFVIMPEMINMFMQCHF